MSEMFVEVIRSEGLAHLSYLIGHGGQAAVIDPRRDCRIYLELAYRHDAAITRVFETHRHEDFVVGSVELARRTGAEILHGPVTDFDYGRTVRQGERFELGDLVLEVLETPGHTDDSLTIAVIDTTDDEVTVAAFTGDALFVGDTGRTDFYPDRAEEVAGLLHDGLFDRILPLGDHVLLYPAHGAGSVCGSSISDREFSTIGIERLSNPWLQIDDRDHFVRKKTVQQHVTPPYFTKMEELNTQGSAPPLHDLPMPPPVSAERLATALDRGEVVLDLRSPEAFAGAFIPGSLAIPLDMVPSFAGHFIPYDRPIFLVNERPDDVAVAVRMLLRMGLDRIEGCLGSGMTAWETSGRPYDRIPAIGARELTERIAREDDVTLLDVRRHDEVAQGSLPGAIHIFLGDLPDRIDELPDDRPVTTFCGSGRRAIIAASILKKHGLDEVENSLGSMAACRAAGCPIDHGAG